MFTVPISSCQNKQLTISVQQSLQIFVKEITTKEIRTKFVYFRIVIETFTTKNEKLKTKIGDSVIFRKKSKFDLSKKFDNDCKKFRNFITDIKAYFDYYNTDYPTSNTKIKYIILQFTDDTNR